MKLIIEINELDKKRADLGMPMHPYRIDKINDAIRNGTPQRSKGKWIFKAFDEETGISDSYWCSECNRPLASAYKDFCASCGSYNGGEEDGNNSACG